jgi:hypothetical protein
MIRNVILMATSGLVLFSKEFANGVAQPRLLGSLLTAILEFSLQTTGMAVSCIQLAGVSVTIVTNDAAKVFCALFHDKEDVGPFGRLICCEILDAFTKEYSTDLGSRNLKDFLGFHSKILHVIRHSVIPVLTRIQSHVGIKKVLLVYEDGSTISPNPTIDTNESAVSLHLQGLLRAASDMSESNAYCILYMRVPNNAYFDFNIASWWIIKLTYPDRLILPAHYLVQ